jgi:hypothetical protein
MTEDNLKDFTINWIITGLLTTCLLMFAITFMYSNNPTGLDKDGTGNIFNSSKTNLNSKLVGIDVEIDSVLNLSAEMDPEKSQLGSRESVSSSFSIFGSGKSIWTQSISLFSWVFQGDVGKILIGTIGSIIGLLGIYYISKFVRGF